MEGRGGSGWRRGRGEEEEGRSAAALTACPHVHCLPVRLPPHHLGGEVARSAGKPCRGRGCSRQPMHLLNTLSCCSCPSTHRHPSPPPPFTKPLQLFKLLSLHGQAKVSQFDLGPMGLAGKQQVLRLQGRGRGRGRGDTYHSSPYTP